MENKNTNLQKNLLTYIAYCLPERSFSYEKCQKDFINIGIKNTIATLRKEFSIDKKEGLIELKTYYHKPYPVLSTKGKLEIKTPLPFRRYSEFDGIWKMVIFDIPDNLHSERVRFKNELKKLGFGKISRGVYLSPHSLFTHVKKLAIRLKIDQYVVFAKISQLEDEKKKVAKAWNLEEINDQYKEYIKKVQQELEKHKKEPTWPFIAKTLEKEFSQIYLQDPQLPEQFLPAEWQGKTAYGIFKALSNSY